MDVLLLVDLCLFLCSCFPLLHFSATLCVFVSLIPPPSFLLNFSGCESLAVLVFREETSFVCRFRQC